MARTLLGWPRKVRDELSMDRYLRFIAELAKAKKTIQRVLQDAIEDAFAHVARAAGRGDAVPSISEGRRR